MQNENWQLAESKWSNPFHWCSNQQAALNTYRAKILRDKELFACLKELHGKRLGCFCEDLEFCHGSVLVELVEEHVVSRLHHVLVHKTMVFFFKGSLSILSNIAECRLIYDGQEFRFLEQLRAYMMAQSVKADFLLEDILRCSTSYAATKLVPMVQACSSSSKEGQAKAWSLQQNVKNMIQLVEIKWLQVPAFREFCRQRSGYLFAEATKSKFWSAGLDITEVSPNTSIASVPGKNVLGWIIYYVFCKSRFDEDVVKNHLIAIKDGLTSCPAKCGLVFLIELASGGRCSPPLSPAEAAGAEAVEAARLKEDTVAAAPAVVSFKLNQQQSGPAPDESTRPKKKKKSKCPRFPSFNLARLNSTTTSSAITTPRPLIPSRFLLKKKKKTKTKKRENGKVGAMMK